MRDYREKLVHGWLSDGNIVGGIPVRVRMTSDDKGQSLSLSTEIGDEADLQIGIPLETANDIVKVTKLAETEILNLYYGMSESMQKAIKDIMIVTQEKKDNDN
jgi:hypothetical protein